MGKVLGAVLIGVVIGAAVSELLRREKPDFCKDLGGKLKKGMGAVKQAFREGYQQASRGTSAAAESTPAS
jgi:hypothetical protein